MKKKPTPHTYPPRINEARAALEKRTTKLKEIGVTLFAGLKRVWEIVTENVQGLSALLVVVALFISTPYLISLAFPNVADAGVAQPGAYIHAASLAVCIFFLGVSMSWLSFQFDFKGFDHFTLKVDVVRLISEIKNPAVKLCVIFAPYFLLLGWFAVSCWVAVSLLK